MHYYNTLNKIVNNIHCFVEFGQTQSVTLSDNHTQTLLMLQCWCQYSQKPRH